MKQIIQVTEVEGKGLLALLGKRVLIMCAGYFYEGRLVGVNSTCVKLEDPGLVYDTGPWDEKVYNDLQKLPAKDWYVSLALIESFGLSKNG